MRTTLKLLFLLTLAVGALFAVPAIATANPIPHPSYSHCRNDHGRYATCPSASPSAPASASATPTVQPTKTPPPTVAPTTGPTPAPTPAPAATLPVTGPPVGALIGGSGALLGVGAGALLLARRRRRADFRA